MSIAVPELSLVVLIGPSGSGKTTFAQRHFRPTEVLSSDTCRGLVADDENDQSATPAAFEVLHAIAERRLAGGRLTVVDATNVKPEDRRPLIELARRHHCLPVAIVFDLGAKVCAERNEARPDRSFGAEVIRGQQAAMRRALRFLQKEGFRYVHTFKTQEEVDAAVVERTPMWTNKRHEHGPFDIIGDVHGCYDELMELLETLGYRVEHVAAGRDEDEQARGDEGTEGRRDEVSDQSRDREGAVGVHRGGALEHAGGGTEGGKKGIERSRDQGIEGNRHDVTQSAGKEDLRRTAHVRVVPPPGRTAIFLGDLVDRGPKIPQVLRLVMGIVAEGTALCVPGNHDVKLMRKLHGRDVQITHGLADSLRQLDEEPAGFREQIARFIDGLVSHYVLDDGKLVVAHAGMKAEMQGRGSAKVREFALYGETTGETDEFGLPIRYDWAAEYRGRAYVVYGHTPVPEPEWLNRTINIDTGCVFGGRLTALRYPEMELLSVPARRVYAESRKPFPPAEEHRLETGATKHGLTAQQTYDDVLDIADVLGKRIISTRLRGNVIVGEDQGAAALEVISRFAANPRWLIYLPPTMSPCETARDGDLLEHPREAFAHYRHQGQPRVVCEEKHMGSRAVVIVCRDEDAARRRFGVVDEGVGIVYTRTGRRFFDDGGRERELLDRVRAALTHCGFWEEMQTDWVCLDCELMPWSAKAQALLQDQYAAVGASARAAMAEVTETIGRAGKNGRDTAALLDHFERRAALTDGFVRAYRQYCWPVASVSDLKLAPFHVLATDGRVHVDRDHVWHMDTLAHVCAADTEVLLATPYRAVDLTDPESEQAGVRWWESLTERGGEGMVVKPFEFVARGPRGLVQPAVKCRGREYLRIIYGPEYTLPEHIERLRARGLFRKRALALREFALGVEALERFVRSEPLRRVHECVFGVLALESEPVDPRL